MEDGLVGVFPMLVTPFAEDGSVDLVDIGRLAGFVLGSGAQGVSILGLGAEVSRLTGDERRSITDIVLSKADGRPVIVGCSAQETQTATALAQYAVNRGAAAVMVAPPADARLDRECLLRHFVAVASAVAPAALMVQDAPAFLGVALDDAFVRRLAAKEPNVQYVKPEGLPASEWAARFSALGFDVFGGHGGLYAMDVLQAGGVGLIPGCEAPAEYARMFGAYAQGKVEQAWREFGSILPLAAFQFQGLDFYIACIKEILVMRGVIRSARLREVANPLTATTRHLLEERAARAGLLP